MRYLSGIIEQDGTRSDWDVHTNWSDFTTRLEITTLETGAVELVTPDKSEQAGKVYGVGFGLLPMQSVFVCHTRKKALLYKYIDYAVSSAHRNELAFFDAQIIQLACDRHNLDPNKKLIAIDSAVDEYKVGGLCGSVCTEYLTLEDRLKCYTLYDFLLELCDQTAVNLLRYETITVFSNEQHFSTTIKLSQSPEAKRFFTKMGFDIGSQRRD